MLVKSATVTRALSVRSVAGTNLSVKERVWCKLMVHHNACSLMIFVHPRKQASKSPPLRSGNITNVAPGDQLKGQSLTRVAPTCLFPRLPPLPPSQSPYSPLAMVDVSGTTTSGMECNWRFADRVWKCYWWRGGGSGWCQRFLIKVSFELIILECLW